MYVPCLIPMAYSSQVSGYFHKQNSQSLYTVKSSLWSRAFPISGIVIHCTLGAILLL